MAYGYIGNIVGLHNISFTCYQYVEEKIFFGHREPFRNRCLLYCWRLVIILGCYDIRDSPLADIKITSDNKSLKPTRDSPVLFVNTCGRSA